MPRRGKLRPQSGGTFEPRIRLEIIRGIVSYASPSESGTASATAANLRATLDEDARRFHKAWVRLARI